MAATSTRRVGRAVGYVVLVLAVCAVVAYLNARHVKAAPGAPGELQSVAASEFDTKDLAEALEMAGVRAWRFDYSIPYPHQVLFSLENYQDGKRDGSVSELGVSNEGGKTRFLVMTREEGDRIHVRVAGEGGSSTQIITVPVQQFPARSEGPLKATLAQGEKVPVYVWMANRQSISGRGDKSVEETVKSYDRVTVLVAELKARPAAR